MPHPQIAVQTAHACIESSVKWPYNGEHPNLVLLSSKNEEHLRKTFDKFKNLGILVTAFYESDGQMTSFATRPIIAEEDRQLFRKYQLIKAK